MQETGLQSSAACSNSLRELYCLLFTLALVILDVGPPQARRGVHQSKGLVLLTKSSVKTNSDQQPIESSLPHLKYYLTLHFL